MKALPFPVRFSDVPFLVFKATEEALIAHFGQYHDRLDDNTFSEPDTCAYWAFEFSCGLEIVITHYDHTNWVNVCADLPEVDHILRHLNLPTPNLWRIEDADPDSLKNSLQCASLDDWNFNQRWQLWRQDDNGIKALMGTYGSERDAACMRDEFEGKGHKQTYWIEQKRID